MAESPPQQPPPPTPATPYDSDESPYWCHQCNMVVRVETLADRSEIVCHECKSCFIELISSDSDASTSNHIFDPSQFVQALRGFAQAAGEEYAPPPSPPSDLVDSGDGDYFRIEIGDDLDVSDYEEEEYGHSYDENEVEEGSREIQFNVRSAEDEGEIQFNVRSAEDEGEEAGEGENEYNNGWTTGNVLHIQSPDWSNYGSEEDEDAEVEEEENEDDNGWTSTNVLHFQFPDWSGILIEPEFAVDGTEDYVGNPDDYVGTEDVLVTLAENLGGGIKGAPPAAKSAVSSLKTFVIELECDAINCAVCKDLVNVGEVAKELACGHGYHGECIVPWLGLRNTCPVCRFELPTDDPDYEESRKNNSSDSSTSGNNFVA